MTWLIRSIFFCIDRNSGIARLMINHSSTTITGMITARVQDRGTSWRRAMMMPPIPIMGAKIIKERPMVTIICTCWTSLVLRVMSEGVPKRLISPWEKLSTFRKNALRTSRPKPMAALAPIYVEVTAHAVCRSATRSM
jgi:hypothetical protein